MNIGNHWMQGYFCPRVGQPRFDIFSSPKLPNEPSLSSNSAPGLVTLRVDRRVDTMLNTVLGSLQSRPPDESESPADVVL